MRRVVPVFIVLALLVLVALPAAADTKIKTRNSMMGQATESTVYIKGARERNEMSGMMGMPGQTSITQCDKKRVITINDCTRSYIIMPLADDAPDAPEAAPAGKPPATTRKGGVITYALTGTDTGEKQKMFGLDARHIKTSMSTQASPDACMKMDMKMERDGWYANISPSFSCQLASGQAMARGMGGYKPECMDTFRFKRSGVTNTGYPLKETTTMTTGGQTFTMTSEVVDLSTANLNPALFEVPAGYREVHSHQQLMGDPQQMMACMGKSMGSGIQAELPGAAPEPEAAPAPAADPAPAAAPAPTVHPKGSGVLRIGVVKLSDKTGQYLPTDNLRMNLMYEITYRHQYEVVPLDAEGTQAIVDEARQKDCDYILYTDAAQLIDPGAPLTPAGNKAGKPQNDPNNFVARLDLSLFKTARVQPQLKTSVSGAAPDRGVDAVMVGFEKESDAVAEQIKKDIAAARAGAKPAVKPAPKKPAPKKQ